MEKKVPIWWVIVASIFTLLIGSGAVWEFQKSRIETARLDLDKTKLSLDIRERMRAMQAEIVKFQAAPNLTEQERKAWIALIENFNAAEKGLAAIEGRKPTLYSFPPSSPRDLTIK